MNTLAIVVIVFVIVVLLLGLFLWICGRRCNTPSTFATQSLYEHRPVIRLDTSLPSTFNTSALYQQKQHERQIVAQHRQLLKDQQQEYHKLTQEKDVKVHAEQKAVLFEKSAGVLPEIIKDGNYGLIIGADATPKHVGGYCIDTIKSTCEYYSFDIGSLPWRLNTPPTEEDPKADSKEFEMKNLLFALLLWTNEIQVQHRVLICTDNVAVHTGNVYGDRVVKYVNHLRKCRRIYTTIKVYGANEDQLRNHAVFIKPADDFSRSNLDDGKRFLRELYDIPVANMKPIYIIKDDTLQSLLWNKCSDCGFTGVEETISLRNFDMS